MASCDFDQDGRSDFAFGNTDADEISIFLSKLGHVVQVYLLPTHRPTVLRCGDVNGDGLDDVIWISETDVNQAMVYAALNQGNASFPYVTPHLVTTLFTNSIRHSMDVGDMDGDGKMDVVSISGEQAIRISFARVDGNNNLLFESTNFSYGFGTFATRVVVSDVTGDSTLDILVACWTDTVVIYLNQYPNFTSVLVPNVPTPHLVTNDVPFWVADLNGDGLKELIGFQTPNVNIFTNLGGGTFNSQGQIISMGPAGPDTE